MKYFLKSVGVFLFVFVLVNIGMYFFMVKPALFSNYIFNKSSISTYQIIMLSDSHGAYLKGLPNKYGIFNLSYISDNYRDMYLKLKYFTNTKDKPDTVLLSIDRHQLSSYRDGMGNINKSIIYAHDFTEFDKNELSLKQKMLPYLKFMPLLYTDINKALINYLSAIYPLSKHGLRDISFADLNEKQKEKACANRYEAQFLNKIKSAKQTKYLQKIIAYCTYKNITLIGVKFPITAIYQQKINSIDFGTERYLVEQNIPVIDFSQLIEQDKYFEDQDHLNYKGGEIFCKALLDSIR